MSDKSQSTDPLILRAPGKFEGEPRWVPHFYEAWLEGHAHESTDDEIAIYVNAEDVERFPELHGFYEVRLRICDHGFVYSTLIPEPPPPLGDRS